MIISKSEPTGAVVARGAMLMVAFKMVERSIGFVSTLLLARLLAPADFGLVAMAMSVVALMELMGAFGFETAIIQRANAERRHFDTAWTFGLIFQTGIAVMLVAFALPAAQFYGDARLAQILPVLAIGACLQGLENIGTVAFRKSMNFGKEFRFLVSKKIITFTVTIGLAFTLQSFWALVIGTVVGKACSVLISYQVHPYRPRLSLAATGDLFHFSRWLFLSNFVIFLQEKSDSFILGRTIGAGDLGLYKMAGEIAALPSTELIAPINRAVFPAYSMLSTELAKLRGKFLEVFRFIAVISLPMSIGLVCVADLLVPVLLGPKWIGAVPMLQLFVVCGLTSALQSNLILVIVALGKPKANTIRSAAMLVIYLPALVWGSVHYGAMGGAWAHLAMSVIALIPLHFVFFHLTRMPRLPYFMTLWRPGLATAFMAASVFAGKSLLVPFAGKLPDLVLLIIYIITGALSYTFTLVALWNLSGRPAESAESAILSKIMQRCKLNK